MAEVIPLAASSRGNWMGWVGLTILSLLGVPTAVLLLAMPFAVESEKPVALAIFGLSMGSLMLGILAFFWIRTILARRRAREAHLRVDDGALTVVHDGVFRQPLVLQPDDIRVIALDPLGVPDGYDEYRFPALPAGPEQPSLYTSRFLWSRGRRSPLPLLGTDQSEVPNLAVIFERPIPAPRVRHDTEVGPQKGEALVGLLMRCADPQRAGEQLESTKRLRGLYEHDLASVELLWQQVEQAKGTAAEKDLGRPREELLVKRKARSGWLLVVVGVLIPWLALVAGIIGIILVADGERRHGPALIVLGFGVFVARLALAAGGA